MNSHELSYMKASLELVDDKEEIEHLLKEKNALDQKLESNKLQLFFPLILISIQFSWLLQ